MASSSLGIGRRVAQPLQRVLRADFIRHGALVFAATMLANVLNYVFNFALSRRLGVEGFASLSSLVSALMILSIPTTILTMVVVKYAATFHAAQDHRRIRRLSQVLLKWSTVAAAAILLAGLLLRGVVSDFLRIPNDASVLLTLGIMAIGFVTPSVRGILQGEEDFVRYSISVVLEVFLKVALAIVLVDSGLGVAGAMGGWCIGTSVALGYTIWAVLNKHGAAAGPTLKLSLDISRLLKTTLGVALATAILICMSFMDVLLVKHYFDARQAGLYAAVNLTGKVVLFLVSFIPSVVLPKAVSRAERGERPLPLLLQAGIVTVGMSGLALGIFGLMPHEVIKLLAGHMFVAAAPYVFQYDAAMGMLAVVTLLVNYKIGIHRFGFLYVLGAILFAEVAAIVTIHRTLWDVIHVLLAGNALAILACSYGITRSPNSALARRTSEAL